MTDEELRDCFAILRAATGSSAEECYKFADEALKARKTKYWIGEENEEDVGIVAVVPKRRTRRS